MSDSAYQISPHHPFTLLASQNSPNLGTDSRELHFVCLSAEFTVLVKFRYVDAEKRCMNPLYRIRKIIFSIAKFKSSKIHLKIMAYLTTYSILAGVFALLYFAWKKLQRGGCHGPLPPGPLGWPVIGNLLTLASGTRNQRLAEIGTKFGGIFTLKMGVS